ncbi:hypothetical protein [Plantactinospora sp. B5E13]|uniref:hypothetical protein n=1 Tax=unclassified Plantactinospora TaxID=2631981 RepID=UPI00325D4C71
MSNEEARLTELRDELRRDDLDLDAFSISFESAVYELAPYEGRDLPPRFVELVNELERIRFRERPENQRAAVVRLVDRAARMLSIENAAPTAGDTALAAYRESPSYQRRLTVFALGLAVLTLTLLDLGACAVGFGVVMFCGITNRLSLVAAPASAAVLAGAVLLVLRDLAMISRRESLGWSSPRLLWRTLSVIATDYARGVVEQFKVDEGAGAS